MRARDVRPASWAVAAGVALAAGGLTGCLPHASFGCTDHEQCSRGAGGACEGNGYCSYPDPSCPSERAYSAFAPAPWTSTCVGEDESSGIGSEDNGTLSPSDPSSSSASSSAESTAAPQPQDWWSCDFSHRRRLQLLGDRGRTLEDFTVLVAIETGELAGVAPDGGDLRFVDDDGTTELAYEIEHWDARATSFVWVRVPQLRLGEGDHFTMYWGDPRAQSVADAPAAWDAHHTGVWHLGTDVRDSSPTGADGSDDSAGPVPGVVGSGRSFARAASSILVGSAGGLDDVFATGGTAMAWVSVTGFAPDGNTRVLGKSQTDPGHAGWKFFVDDEPHPSQGGSDHTLGFMRGYDGNHAEWRGPTDAVPADGSWHLVAVTFCDDPAICGEVCVDDCSNDDCTPTGVARPRLFVDGDPALTIDVTFASRGDIALSDAPYPMILGRGPAGGEGLVGALDEVRISRVVRCDTWLRTEYQSMTGTLLAAGEIETAPCE
jgi:hypothetical protein